MKVSIKNFGGASESGIEVESLESLCKELNSVKGDFIILKATGPLSPGQRIINIRNIFTIRKE